MRGAAVEENHLLALKLDRDRGNLAHGPRTDAFGTQLIELARVREHTQVKLSGFFGVVIEPEEWRNFVHGWNGSKQEVTDDKPTSVDQPRPASASVSSDRLPKLDAISFRVGDPAELSEVIAFAFWIDGDTFGYQTVQHSIEVIHLEIDHCFLCRRKVCILLFEQGEDDLSVLRRSRKRERSLGLYETDMPLVPAI
jgi:hypothetical protein